MKTQKEKYPLLMDIIETTIREGSIDIYLGNIIDINDNIEPQILCCDYNKEESSISIHGIIKGSYLKISIKYIDNEISIINQIYDKILSLSELDQLLYEKLYLIDDNIESTSFIFKLNETLFKIISSNKFKLYKNKATDTLAEIKFSKMYFVNNLFKLNEMYKVSFNINKLDRCRIVLYYNMKNQSIIPLGYVIGYDNEINKINFIRDFEIVLYTIENYITF